MVMLAVKRSSLHSDIVAPVHLRLRQQGAEGPLAARMAAGELIGAIAMTEPGAGSDLQGVRTTGREAWRQLRHQRQQDLHHQRHHLADVVLVVCKTDPTQGARGTSILIVEEGLPGFRVGRVLDKMGMKSAGHLRAVLRRRDRAGRQPAGRQEGQGFFQLMGRTCPMSG
jgi:acyl-CoA dehydrogenase